MERHYIAIDLKSFYASVECMERGLDPMTTLLTVADAARTEKTICLAVSPALKSFGIPGRPRLFEVVQRVNEVNFERRAKAPGHRFTGSTTDITVLQSHPEYELSYIAAAPRMANYMKYSTQIYNIYLRYIAPEDIHVYSVDEIFADVTNYLATYRLTARELALTMIREVLNETGITATAGIGTNLLLAKFAMDIVAKKMPPDRDGVRIAELDERSYRKQLWNHVPLTDFWRVGRGYATKLNGLGLYTMGDIARCSMGKESDYFNEALLYKTFGIHAELLIDHAWGYEPTTIAEIKAYKPESHSVSSGQVLQHPYTAERCRIIVKEMTDLLVLDLVDKGVVTNQLTLTIGYDVENFYDKSILSQYHGEVTTDAYGRKIPKHAHGTIHLPEPTSSTKQILKAVCELYDRIINPILLTRRVNVTANNVVAEEAKQDTAFEQFDLFTDYEGRQKQTEQKQKELEKEKRAQKAILAIQKKYGKNALLKGINFEEGAMTRERNGQIGGHKA